MSNIPTGNLDNVLLAGQRLSNAAYNLSESDSLTQDERQTLRALVNTWDRVVVALTRRIKPELI